MIVYAWVPPVGAGAAVLLQLNVGGTLTILPVPVMIRPGQILVVSFEDPPTDADRLLRSMGIPSKPEGT